ncbi:hypothetical protein C1637_22865 [Chryseobacterium lactis]|uniref:Uncharacterized protein n=1 Tax=Chryseobacterium lactis TaxID=1241981 RepID=A0A3G6RUC6_CHRLC|nr:hypothetical protein [Chryseobacterium lactis]AZA80484.1 hypothetical protein EG342_00470 [Chryseobacterium lactis]AZB05486.1 hypothetical protein EG341_16595 [Chryseobacterium lactis]PNW11379.1 hypothetical protein C1637_22865 [Chryseobacterium lactis]
MKRALSMYMFDKDKASTRLYEDLQHRLYHTQTFRDYIEERKREPNTDNISFENILETVKNDINLITIDDLLEITLFFNSQLYPLFSQDSSEVRVKYIEDLYDYLGITCLYQLPDSACTAYSYQYEWYTETFPIDRLYKDKGANIRSDDFLHFNDYVILVAKGLIDTKVIEYECELTSHEELIIETIKTEYQDHVLLLEIIEEQVKFLVRIFYPDDRSPYVHTVYHACEFLKQSIQMKSMINTKNNPRIVILDSY